ncbi:MAG TPA: choice-of-anchor Q domain-containing protein [Pyrinomonadaceae bacterium]|jgi:CSLREA domain-containing protein|nr:choice-of-anchor Q domain-containing protein [Pyrinomonadaceae bacterium]
MKTITRAALTALIVLSFSIGVAAATFVVNTTADTLDTNLGNGICEDAGSNCSLRAAISEANALAGPDIITLAATIYTQSIPNDGVNETNLNGDLDITSAITINGVSQAATIIEAATSRLSANDRVLDVRPGGNLTLNNVTVRHGRPVSGVPPHGGGIHSSGTLSLTDVTVTDNETGGGEGAGGGGGIGNEGPSITLTNTTVTGNFVNNVGGTAYGGGFSSFTTPPDVPAAITISNSTISGNFTHGIADIGTGAFFNGVYTLNALDSHFDNNISSAISSSAGTGLQALNFASGQATLSIVNCTFNGNTGSLGSFGATGAGMQFTTSNTVNAAMLATLDGVTVDGNTATNAGGDGGSGIKILGNGGPIGLDVRNTTISNNSGAPFGGGMYITNVGGIFQQSHINVNFLNTTLSGNSANVGGAYAALIGSNSQARAVFDACTITGNSAISSAGGASAVNAEIFVTRTVVAGNTAPSGPDGAGTFISLDYNHFGNTAGVFYSGAVAHNTTGNAMLGALQNNGGPTLTHMPAVGSPLLDAIPVGQNSCNPGPWYPIYSDQRGFGRPFGSGCDKGSVERGATLAAGPWSLSGTVKTTAGQPIRNAAVQISGGNLPAPVTVFTGNFGTYQFTNLSGNEYTVAVTVKRYHFNVASQVFLVGSNITEADFIANAPFNRELLLFDPAPVKEKGLK